MLELSQGTQLAERYTLIRRLGSGGEASTWLAKDRLTAGSVALKITSAESEVAKRLRAEWQASIRLMHAHITRAFEYYTEADVAFYSQQYIDGENISVLTGRSTDEILSPIGLIADALRYVHAKGIVHRDVKASNILLDHNGAPYLTDFGVACPVGDVGVGGSLIAASPQSLLAMPAQTADDIFALGGLIYELISGKSPYSSIDTAEDIQHRVPQPLHSRDGRDVPSSIVELVAQMLDKEASKRPSAEDVATRLTAAGFSPGVATAGKGTKHVVPDEMIEAVESIRPVNRFTSDAPTAVEKSPTGISKLTTTIALSALLIVLVAVIFILPNRVGERSNDEDGRQVTGNANPTGVDGTGVTNDLSNSDAALESELRNRIRKDVSPPVRKLADDDNILFNENAADFSGLDAEGRARFDAEATLGALLSALEVLERRGVERWAPIEHRKSRELYAEGDKAYLDKDFARAEDKYIDALAALEPLYERIEPAFQKAFADATSAFDEGNRLEALRLYELAVAITPGHVEATAGYERAKNLEAVLSLVEQGIDYEQDLELEAAQRSFEQAIELDELWVPALEGRSRVMEARTKMEFDLLMTDGIEAIAAGDYLSARAAFLVAQKLIPGSAEPADGLQQVEQGLRLQDITTLEREALSLENDEHWDAVVTTYEEILKVDPTLIFAQDGLSRASKMSALHAQLDKFIAEPDRLSFPSVLQEATMLVVNITTRPNVGPRLAGQRDELSRLMKRAVTALPVPLVSDNVTEVSIYRVGKLGNFTRRQVSLRPGTYVAVGIRPGYRDVRHEFRVAPEIDIEPIVVQCEEPI